MRIGLLLGRLPASENARVMGEFKRSVIDLLVATTVIEVGVDVPNATLMVIDNPERLGLAQLHQLRGRVGRGAANSHCILLFAPPLGALAEKRLKVLRSTQDGFRIAESDLELRGPGDVLGPRQTGEQQPRRGLGRDATLVAAATELAGRLLDAAPGLAREVVALWNPGEQDYTSV
jgi:ATP-dependent DNA helicase RecG